MNYNTIQYTTNAIPNTYNFQYKYKCKCNIYNTYKAIRYNTIHMHIHIDYNNSHTGRSKNTTQYIQITIVRIPVPERIAFGTNPGHLCKVGRQVGR